jgi:hypothetical protein
MQEEFATKVYERVRLRQMIWAEMRPGAIVTPGPW